jgi:hypothetical protein
MKGMLISSGREGGRVREGGKRARAQGGKRTGGREVGAATGREASDG